MSRPTIFSCCVIATAIIAGAHASMATAQVPRPAAAGDLSSSTSGVQPALALIHKLDLPEGVDGEAWSPTTCTVNDAGVAYFANSQRPGIFVRPLDVDSLRAFPVARHELPRVATAMTWSHPRGLLLVLDIAQNAILAYGSDGVLVDNVLLVGGQTGFALVALPSGGFLVGGERWETRDSATLIARYDSSGRLRTAFFPMSQYVRDQNIHLLTPVVLADASDDEFVVAEPTSFQIWRIDLGGNVLEKFGSPPLGYGSPSAMPPTITGPDQLNGWLRSWTPLVFLEVVDDLILAGFRRRGMASQYMVQVYDRRSNHRRAISRGIELKGRPLCAGGRSLYAVGETDAAAGAIFEYELHIPTSVDHHTHMSSTRRPAND